MKRITTHTLRSAVMQVLMVIVLALVLMPVTRGRCAMRCQVVAGNSVQMSLFVRGDVFIAGRCCCGSRGIPCLHAGMTANWFVESSIVTGPPKQRTVQKYHMLSTIAAFTLPAHGAVIRQWLCAPVFSGPPRYIVFRSILC